MISETIKKQIEVGLVRAGFDLSHEVLAKWDWDIELTKDFTHGDYASNVALIVGKNTAVSPLEIAEKLLPHMDNDADGYIKKVEIAGPGFLNFFLSDKYYSDVLLEIVEKKNKWGWSDELAEKKVMVEYTDPNVMKPFHIGHLMSNAIGEALARLFETSGAEVRRVNYFSDVGLAIAKAVWGMKEMRQTMPDENAPVADRTDFLGKAYVFGVAQATSPEVLEEIKQINKQIYNKLQGESLELYEIGRKWSLEHFEGLYKKLGTSFDYLIGESEIVTQALELAKESLLKKIFVESEGAIVFKAEAYGLHTRVFVTKEQLPTYEAKDMALVKKKFELFSFDNSVSITGNEQNEYFKVVLKAINLMMPEMAGKTKHMSHGMLRLSSGKMSSRTGNVITGETLITDVEKIAQEKNPDPKVASAVAIGAIKYSILRQAPSKDIIFDFEKSLSLEGDSGPYLQYAYARARSVLAKANFSAQGGPSSDWQFSNEEKKIMRLIARLPEILAKAREELAPQFVCTYLIELAGAWNSYYAINKIIDEDDKATTQARLALTVAIAQTLANGLWTLGIPALNRM